MKLVILAVLCLAALASSYSNIELSSLRGMTLSNGTTVSGISSGAFFSVQMQVAYSSIIAGAGVIAGGPYYCAQGNMGSAVTTCMNFPVGIYVNSLISYAKSQASSGKIDPVSNMQTQKAYVFSGTKDTVVKSGVAEKLIQFYKSFMEDSGHVYEHQVPAEHAWINNAVTGWGNSCEKFGEPYVNVCSQRNVPYDMLNFILNNPKRGLKVEVKKPEQKGISSPDNLHVFSQHKFLPGDLNAVGLDNEGYVYVPKSCGQTKCLVHFSFHGCNQQKGKVQDVFALHNDLNDFAELNNVIIVYPQAHTTSSNPQGCWDWWGYTNSNYAVKSGPQMAAVRNMLSDMGI